MKTKHLVKSILQFHKPHLMDDVWYNGEKCFLNNGIKGDGEGGILWNVVKKEWNNDGTRNSWEVPTKQIKKNWTWFTFCNSLFYYYRWWKKCWYQIDLAKRLECNVYDV